MIVRRGKDEGWLHLDVHGVQRWATASGIKFTSASPAHIPGRGIGLVADHSVISERGQKPCQILELTEELVLSLEAVKQHASFDQDFREVLESIGEFGRVGLLALPSLSLNSKSLVFFSATYSAIRYALSALGSKAFVDTVCGGVGMC